MYIDGLHGGVHVCYGAAYHDIGSGGVRVQEVGVDVGEAGVDMLGRYSDIVMKGRGILINII